MSRLKTKFSRIIEFIKKVISSFTKHEKCLFLCFLIAVLSGFIFSQVTDLYIRNIFIIICFISTLVFIVMLNYGGVLYSAIGSYTTYLFLLTALTNFKPFTDETENFSKTKGFFIIILIFYCLLLFNALRLVFQVCVPYKKNPSKLFVKEFTFWRKTIAIIIIYVLLIASTIFIFAFIYEAYNSHGYVEGQGLYYSASLGDSTNLRYLDNGDVNVDFTNDNISSSAILAASWEPFYFSTVTFFTVGYGDIIPIGSLLKNIVQIEMFLGNVLTVIFAALLVSGLQQVMNERIQQESTFAPTKVKKNKEKHLIRRNNSIKAFKYGGKSKKRNVI